MNRGWALLFLLPMVVYGAPHAPDSASAHWAFKPLRRPAVPKIQNPKSKIPNPIDAFIDAKLREKRMFPVRQAGRRTLIRRVYFDLIGLPPSADEYETHMSDKSNKWFERMVDALLASPHYGERWGRHWLDVARYADSDGRESDNDRPNAYRYRDFVIRALNEDMPFDRFVRWQLAGDEYEPANPLAIAATGFIVAGPHAELPANLLEEERIRERYNDLDDMVSTTGQAFLALTTGCARCHDHKYDPISIRDYYRMSAIFNSGDRADVPLLPPPAAEKWKQADAEWQKQLDAAKKAKDTVAIREVEARKPATPELAYAMDDFGAQARESWLLARGSMHAKSEKVQLGFISSLVRGKPVQAYWEAAKATRTRDDSSFQRRALADWITDTHHGPGALLARVIVNRLWQGHFGEGIVRTVNDFGKRSEAPSHPELLEWLAAELVNPGVQAFGLSGVRNPSDGSNQSGLPRRPNVQKPKRLKAWSLKRIHRLILTSEAYKRGTGYDAAAARKDPENRLLWRRRPRRMESEVYRDSLLSVSGEVRLQIYGPAFKAPIPQEAILARNVKDPYPTNIKDGPENHRRSIYMFHKRVVPVPLIQLLDGADSAASCGRRLVTTVAPQALAALNEPFVRLRSREFAQRIMKEGGADSAARIRRAFLLALSRSPSEKELNAGIRFIQGHSSRRGGNMKTEDGEVQAFTDFAQALVGLNEFIYVD